MLSKTPPTQLPQIDQPVIYEIRLKGCLSNEWANWFENFSVVQQDDETILSGPVVDQPALFGVLRKVRDCGLTLLAVNQVDQETAGF